MTLYETLKFIHIVAAAVVLGGGLILTMFGLSALMSKKTERVLAISTISSWAGPRIFAPAWVLVLAFGVWATLEGDLDFGDAWITIGFVVFAIGFVLGPTVHERNGRALSAAIEADGPTSEAALATARREVAVGLVEIALLIFAIWAMTAKPGL